MAIKNRVKRVSKILHFRLQRIFEKKEQQAKDTKEIEPSTTTEDAAAAAAEVKLPLKVKLPKMLLLLPLPLKVKLHQLPLKLKLKPKLKLKLNPVVVAAAAEATLKKLQLKNNQVHQLILLKKLPNQLLIKRR